jgi:hypothetical protein
MKDFEFRMVDEAVELEGRIERLASFLNENEVELDPIEASIMRSQLGHMRSYHATLLMRLELHNVVMDEPCDGCEHFEKCCDEAAE